jgi:hypothetical protein
MRLAKLTSSHGLLTMTTAFALATTVACTAGSAPELNGLSDQVAQVGTEFKLDLNGTDPDGDRLSYDFRAADLDTVRDRAMITVSPSGAGVFRWTPVAQDVGMHAFDFVVSDGDSDTTVTINIEVKSAIGSATAPVFRQPLGTGTTIDLAQKQCVDLKVVVEDQDTAQLDITQEEPLIEGATLTQEDGQKTRSLVGCWLCFTSWRATRHATSPCLMALTSSLSGSRHRSPLTAFWCRTRDSTPSWAS